MKYDKKVKRVKEVDFLNLFDYQLYNTINNTFDGCSLNLFTEVYFFHDNRGFTFIMKKIRYCYKYLEKFKIFLIKTNIRKEMFNKYIEPVVKKIDIYLQKEKLDKELENKFYKNKVNKI